MIFHYDLRDVAHDLEKNSSRYRHPVIDNVLEKTIYFVRHGQPNRRHLRISPEPEMFRAWAKLTTMAGRLWKRGWAQVIACEECSVFSAAYGVSLLQFFAYVSQELSSEKTLQTLAPLPPPPPPFFCPCSTASGKNKALGKNIFVCLDWSGGLLQR